jgi:SAM-dependent methyltransferase
MDRLGIDLKAGLVKPLAPHEREVLDRFGAQIGELAWHRTHVDPTLVEISNMHADRICELANEFHLTRPRILEVGAYAHSSSLIAAARLGGEAWAHDISPDSLRVGKQIGRELQIDGQLVSVAGDFHDLPFEDNMFDIVFIASAVHHTWQPGKVIAELGRVTKPNGILHLENEPVGRSACLYQFRGNRAGERTKFEDRLEFHGLTHTISSPFPGSRAEALFGIVENDRIPIEIYETSLKQSGDVARFDLDCGGLVNSFETWLLEDRPSAFEIANRLIERVEEAAADFSAVDVACGLSIPSPDEIWPMAYRLEEALKSIDAASHRDLAVMFGSALRATVVKQGSGNARGEFRRGLSNDHDILIDDKKSKESGLTIVDVPFDPTSGEFGDDWIPTQEEGGHYSLCNSKSDCELEFYRQNSVIALRMYSVFVGEQYRISILKNDELSYQHQVSRSESHLASIFVSPSDRLRVYMHHEDGSPYELPWGTRLVIKQVPWETV